MIENESVKARLLALPIRELEVVRSAVTSPIPSFEVAVDFNFAGPLQVGLPVLYEVPLYVHTESWGEEDDDTYYSLVDDSEGNTIDSMTWLINHYAGLLNDCWATMESSRDLIDSHYNSYLIYFKNNRPEDAEKFWNSNIAPELQGQADRIAIMEVCDRIIMALTLERQRREEGKPLPSSRVDKLVPFTTVAVTEELEQDSPTQDAADGQSEVEVTTQEGFTP